MDIKMLDAKYHVDVESDCKIRYVKSDTEYFRLHNHNYYEIFLTIHGSVNHLINNRLERIEAGSLLFIRDFDIHSYSPCDKEGFDFINLSFGRETLDMLFDFLGDGFSSENLLAGEFPPEVILSAHEKDKLFYSLIELNSINNNAKKKSKMRVLLTNIFMTYFDGYSCEKNDIPLWLEFSVEKMKKAENFIIGFPKLLEIAGKSREYVSRCMKKYYNQSPTEFLNGLRINYAVNLMRTSNLSITDICYECGFQNISWFYKIFIKEFGTSPAAYRKAHSIKEE